MGTRRSWPESKEMKREREGGIGREIGEGDGDIMREREGERLEKEIHREGGREGEGEGGSRVVHRAWREGGDKGILRRF